MNEERARRLAVLDPRLVELALTDEVVHGAVQAYLAGTPLETALMAAVLSLAQWKRVWSPEATRAVMLQPPPPITICCAGKHDKP